MRNILCAGFLLITGCAAETDPWVGTYHGTAFHDWRGCVSGAHGSLGPDDFGIVLARDESGELVWSSLCAFPVIELGEGAARLAPFECDSTLPDGTPVHVRVVNGALERNGDELALRAALDSVTPDACITSVVDFVGYRE